MDDQTRRRFCQLCLMAGAGIGSAVSLAKALPQVAASEALPDEKKNSNHANQNFDYTKIGYCGYRCDICPGRSEDKKIRKKNGRRMEKAFRSYIIYR